MINIGKVLVGALALTTVAGAVAFAVPQSREFILDKLAVHSTVYKDKESENKTLTETNKELNLTNEGLSKENGELRDELQNAPTIVDYYNFKVGYKVVFSTKGDTNLKFAVTNKDEIKQMLNASEIVAEPRYTVYRNGEQVADLFLDTKPCSIDENTNVQIKLIDKNGIELSADEISECYLSSNAVEFEIRNSNIAYMGSDDVFQLRSVSYDVVLLNYDSTWANLSGTYHYEDSDGYFANLNFDTMMCSGFDRTDTEYPFTINPDTKIITMDLVEYGTATYEYEYNEETDSITFINNDFYTDGAFNKVEIQNGFESLNHVKSKNHFFKS